MTVFSLRGHKQSKLENYFQNEKDQLMKQILFTFFYLIFSMLRQEHTWMTKKKRKKSMTGFRNESLCTNTCWSWKL